MILYVPQVAANLLSVSSLIKNGNVVVFNHNGCRIYNKARALIGTANFVGNIYKLNVVNPDLQKNGKWLATVDVKCQAF